VLPEADRPAALDDSAKLEQISRICDKFLDNPGTKNFDMNKKTEEFKLKTKLFVIALLWLIGSVLFGQPLLSLD
jgi:hypothetical protein